MFSKIRSTSAASSSFYCNHDVTLLAKRSGHQVFWFVEGKGQSRRWEVSLLPGTVPTLCSVNWKHLQESTEKCYREERGKKRYKSLKISKTRREAPVIAMPLHSFCKWMVSDLIYFGCNRIHCVFRGKVLVLNWGICDLGYTAVNKSDLED